MAITTMSTRLNDCEALYLVIIERFKSTCGEIVTALLTRLPSQKRGRSHKFSFDLHCQMETYFFRHRSDGDKVERNYVRLYDLKSPWTMLINQWQALDRNSTLSGTKIGSQSTEPSLLTNQFSSDMFFFFAWDPGWDWVYFYVRNILSIYFLFKRRMKWECDSPRWFKTDWTDIPVPQESSLALTGAWKAFLCGDWEIKF